MVAPHFERLAKENSRPKKMAFAKVNVDHQSTIARTAGVAAMPTFKIYQGGNCVDTIKGANPAALSEAVAKASKLADAAVGGKPADAFKSPGRTLGSEGTGAKTAAARRGPSFDLGKMLNLIVSFIGLYVVSLLSVRIPSEVRFWLRIQQRLTLRTVRRIQGG
jgi:thioredoxin 1